MTDDDDRKQFTDLEGAEKEKALKAVLRKDKYPFTITMNDDDFCDFYDLESYTQLAKNGKACDYKVRLEVVYED